VAINLIHISPQRTTQELVAGGGRVLSPGGVLSTYETNKENRAHTVPSNAAFDQDLIGRNLEWGVRDLEEVASCRNQWIMPCRAHSDARK
jgi:hypothetical protein